MDCKYLDLKHAQCIYHDYKVDLEEVCADIKISADGRGVNVNVE